MLLTDLGNAEFELSQRMGEFELFGLFRRRRSVGWELVATAPWFDPGLRPTIEVLLEVIGRVTGRPALESLSRILVMPDRSFIEAMHETVTVQHGLEVVGPGDFGNVEVARGYVITNKRPAVAMAT